MRVLPNRFLHEPFPNTFCPQASFEVVFNMYKRKHVDVDIVWNTAPGSARDPHPIGRCLLIFSYVSLVCHAFYRRRRGRCLYSRAVPATYCRLYSATTLPRRHTLLFGGRFGWFTLPPTTMVQKPGWDRMITEFTVDWCAAVRSGFFTIL